MMKYVAAVAAAVALAAGTAVAAPPARVQLHAAREAAVLRDDSELARGPGDFRGTYGNPPVALFVGEVQDASVLRETHGVRVDSRPYSPEAGGQLYALVFDHSEHKPAALRALLRDLGESVHDAPWHFADSGVAFVTLSREREWPAWIEDIPVPRRAMRPQPRAEESPIFESVVRPAREGLLRADDRIAADVARVSTDELYTTDVYLSETFNSRQSASATAREAKDYLRSRFESLGLAVEEETFIASYAPNLYAEVRGAVNPEQVVMVGAHYDSRSTDSSSTSQRAPGADDNASGSSAVLELARIVTTSNTTFSYTIRFALWSGEEQGLLGSAAYASRMADEGAQFVAYLNADMLGFRVPGSELRMGMKDRYITEWLLSTSIAVSNLYVPELPVLLSSSCCSDYRSFYENGFPAIGYFENPTTASTYPDYHTSNDVSDNVDFEQLTLETKAFLAGLLTFAAPVIGTDRA